MRFYGFCNYYLGSLQQALQAAHVIADLGCVRKRYPQEQFEDWAQNHKTIILLNGGNSGDLKELATSFSVFDNQYAWASFCEDEVSLNSAMTCVGIIVPEIVYETAAAIRNGWLYDATSRAGGFQVSDRGVHEADFVKLSEYAAFYNSANKFDHELITSLNSCGLAK